MAGGQRIFEVIDAKIEVVDAPDAVELRQFKGKSIMIMFPSSMLRPGSNPRCHLHINPGETIAFVGTTGAGKSTMVALVDRFYDVTTGSLNIDGHDIKKSHPGITP